MHRGIFYLLVLHLQWCISNRSRELSKAKIRCVSCSYSSSWRVVNHWSDLCNSRSKCRVEERYASLSRRNWERWLCRSRKVKLLPGLRLWSWARFLIGGKVCAVVVFYDCYISLRIFLVGSKCFRCNSRMIMLSLFDPYEAFSFPSCLHRLSTVIILYHQGRKERRECECVCE